ncbi:MAG: group III truncated hemoglobin [Candidatus Didemnitutus sp.]|nr:group III truncated hemoglobin [Candidatus Didemnitutus sp.]
MDAPASSLFARLGGRPHLLQLLRHFYADVRQHREIGPIFLAQIDDWPAHLEKIADFWSNVTGGPVRYGGGMPRKHFPLGLEARHFEVWLDLWRRNCRAQLPAVEAEEMIRAAEEIGQRLRDMIAQHAAVRPSPES